MTTEERSTLQCRAESRVAVAGGFTAAIEPWSGSRRPWRAKVYRADGSYLGTTGGCATPNAAIAAASRLATGMQP